MRIRHIKIDRWRHFDNVEIFLPDDAPLICIVGSNGTGKSQILELLAACALKIGLTPGFEIARGDPFQDSAKFQVTFLLARGSFSVLDDSDAYQGAALQEDLTMWDRTITVSRGYNHPELTVGGVLDERGHSFAFHTVELIRGSNSTHYLFLDADRAYPKIQIHDHQLTETFSRNWSTTRKQSSFRTTRNLYEEWFRFMIGEETQSANKHVQAIRRARDEQTSEPQFIDQFHTYKTSLRKVLPHLLFAGVDTSTRQIRFDTTGSHLNFDQLSGGEREIAFLIGQVERFGLKRGLFLVDEPELHLNSDLIRTWIEFLKDSVEQGQIWLATHSLEVVEVAGPDATIILQRDEASRRVTGATPLSQQPVITALSRALGSPAFSMSTLAFVFIEGEETIGERERYKLICRAPSNIRFLEAGSCKQVVQRKKTLEDIAKISCQSLRIGGVVDRDLRSHAEQDELRSHGVFVLGVHEVENFFLHPASLQNFLEFNGRDPDKGQSAVREKADSRAGAWVFYAVRTSKNFRTFPEPTKEVRELVHSLTWLDFAELDSCCERITNAYAGLDHEQIKQLKQHLVVHAKKYGKSREDGTLWKICEGKEVFRGILSDLGIANEDAGERAIAAVWERCPDLIPVELIELRTYVRNL